MSKSKRKSEAQEILMPAGSAEETNAICARVPEQLWKDWKFACLINGTSQKDALISLVNDYVTMTLAKKKEVK